MQSILSNITILQSYPEEWVNPEKINSVHRFFKKDKEGLRFEYHMGAKISYAALHIATYFGNPTILSDLLEVKDIDINIKIKGEKKAEEKEKINYTCLHIAAEEGNKEIAEVLLDKGINIDSQDLYDNTALHLAVKAGHLQLTQLLLSRDANIDSQNLYGNTALHLAVEKGWFQLTQLLLEKGANAKLCNSEGRKPAENTKDLFFNRTVLSYQNSLFLAKQSKDNAAKEGLADPTIVWAKPFYIEEEGRESFIYSSKKPEKTVYIPFRFIHKNLISANWLMRPKVEALPDEANYLVAHLLFIVSDSPYPKRNGKDKVEYQGRRDLIHFPISLHDKQGKYFKSETSRAHSERALYEQLTSPDIVKGIVDTLKTALSSSNVKIYGCQLFLNSKNNVCNMKDSGAECEKLLADLMTSTKEGSFLSVLKQNLGGIELPKNGFPRMLISVSAHKYYQAYCTGRLRQDAENALDYSAQHIGYIDSKLLSGKVILSTAERWIDDKSAEEHHKEVGIALSQGRETRPNYTGFASSQGFIDLIDIYNKRQAKETTY